MELNIVNGAFLDVVCPLASRILNFYIVPRGGKVPLHNQVAGQMGRLGHDNREESGCARS